MTSIYLHFDGARARLLVAIVVVVVALCPLKSVAKNFRMTLQYLNIHMHFMNKNYENKWLVGECVWIWLGGFANFM